MDLLGAPFRPPQPSLGNAAAWPVRPLRAPVQVQPSLGQPRLGARPPKFNYMLLPKVNRAFVEVHNQCPRHCVKVTDPGICLNTKKTANGMGAQDAAHDAKGGPGRCPEIRVCCKDNMWEVRRLLPQLLPAPTGEPQPRVARRNQPFRGAEPHVQSYKCITRANDPLCRVVTPYDSAAAVVKQEKALFKKQPDRLPAPEVLAKLHQRHPLVAISEFVDHYRRRYAKRVVNKAKKETDPSASQAPQSQRPSARDPAPAPAGGKFSFAANNFSRFLGGGATVSATLGVAAPLSQPRPKVGQAARSVSWPVAQEGEWRRSRKCTFTFLSKHIVQGTLRMDAHSA
eukprot:gene22613-biopygen2754